jgi:biopolymer transport protein ExbD
MRFRNRPREEPEVIITPLIDIVFLLLIFFMVSTTFQRDSALSIALPEASAEPTTLTEESIEVSVDVQGRYYVNGVELVNASPDTLRLALKSAAKGRESPPVVINSDAKATVQALITVMDAARRLGFVNLTFATQMIEEDSK